MLNGLGESLSDIFCGLVPICAAGSMAAQGISESESASSAAAGNGGVLPSTGLSTTEWLLIGGAALAVGYFLLRRK